MKYLTIKCDGINSISSQYYSGEIEIELENPDYQFIQDLEADLLLRNGLDWETFVKEIDKDDLCEFLTNYYGFKIIEEQQIIIAVLSYLGEPTSHEILPGIVRLGYEVKMACRAYMSDLNKLNKRVGNEKINSSKYKIKWLG